MKFIKRICRLAALAVALVVANPVMLTPILAPVAGEYGSAAAQSLSDAFNNVDQGSSQISAGIKLIGRGIAVVVFLGFFLWALASGRWDFVKLVGMAGAVVGFAAVDKIVSGLMAIGTTGS